LALGGIGGDTRRQERLIQDLLNKRKEELGFVENVIRALWRGIEALTDGARQDWVQGCFFLWWRQPAADFIELAAARFSRAVERELLERVFRPFVRSSGVRPPEKQHGMSKSDQVWRRMVQRQEGSLGDLLWELVRAKNPASAISKAFSQWLNGGFQSLALGISEDDAGRLGDYRTPAVHATRRTLGRADAEDMWRRCQQLLTLIHDGPQA